MKRLFVEGLPGAGKSTVVDIIQKQNIPVMKELGYLINHDEFPGNGQTVEEVLEIDDWFIDKEEARTAMKNGIFDRSYFTHLTYAYAYGRHKNLRSMEKTIDKYSNALNIGRLAVPDSIAYIDIEPELSIERQRKRAWSGVPPLDAFWEDKIFLQDLREAYDELFNACENIPISYHDGSLDSEHTASEIKNNYIGIQANDKRKRVINLGRYATRMQNI